MYINVLRPTQMLPTSRQQRARAACLYGKKRDQVSLIYANWADVYDIKRRTVRRPMVKSQIEMTALNTTYKLLHAAFGNYANGQPTVASRPIPSSRVIGQMSHDAFAAMVKEYAKWYVRQKSKVSVTHEEGRISLSVGVKEPKVSKASSGDRLYITI